LHACRRLTGSGLPAATEASGYTVTPDCALSRRAAELRRSCAPAKYPNKNVRYGFKAPIQFFSDAQIRGADYAVITWPATGMAAIADVGVSSHQRLQYAGDRSQARNVALAIARRFGPKPRPTSFRPLRPFPGGVLFIAMHKNHRHIRLLPSLRMPKSGQQQHRYFRLGRMQLHARSTRPAPARPRAPIRGRICTTS
jgi:hypothetical protein